MNKENKIIFISGPTGVGKSDFAEYLARNLGCDTFFINGDMGQLYTPLTIGTAKPQDTSDSYLFNVINEPLNLGSYTFRTMVIDSINKCWSKKKVPIIVGGSGFYMKSLFYSSTSFDIDQNSDPAIEINFSGHSTQDLYKELTKIDSIRAAEIYQNDRYRIERALTLWKRTLQKPSDLKPKFEPLGSCFYYFLTRDKKELHNRIRERTIKMFEAGWLDEVRGLNDSWKQFLLKKKLIGYPEIIQYLDEELGDQNSLIEKIGYKTVKYAKRQLTFWRSLQKQLMCSDLSKQYIKDIQEFDLTNNFECLKDIIVKNINEN